MSESEDPIQQYRVAPGAVNPLKTFPTRSKGEFKHKRDAIKVMKSDIKELDELQQVLFAQSKYAVLIVLQALDTGGKDGTIRHVLGPLNPQGVRVHSFKKPTPEELRHDYLWRIHRVVPGKGRITIFNRSHYEDVLVVRVHDLAPREILDHRYEQINNFEKYLAQNNVVIVKFFLHISKKEQKERLQSRLDRPDKHWKFSSADLKERAFWDKYQEAYDLMLAKCSTDWAPWYIIPADRKWYRNFLVARILRQTLQQLDLEYPPAEEGLDQIVIDD